MQYISNDRFWPKAASHELLTQSGRCLFRIRNV
jgi:hypothetical protein